MKVEKRVHQGYTEMENARLHGIKITQLFGKWQYVYTQRKFIISLVKLKDYFSKKWYWEICCIKGELFEDIERYATKKEAEERVEGILRIWR